MSETPHATDVEISRALNALVVTLSDQKATTADVARWQAIVTGALGGEERLHARADGTSERHGPRKQRRAASPCSPAWAWRATRTSARRSSTARASAGTRRCRAPDGTLIRKAGVMAIVVTPGTVSPGDAIAVTRPPEPHERLAPV